MLAENNGRAISVDDSVSIPRDEELEIRLMFLHEATDYLKKIVEILEITGSKLDKKQIESVRGAAHSIKGSAAMMGFQTLSDLARRMEDFLKTFENQQSYPISSELKGLLLAFADQMHACIALNSEGKVVDDAWLEPVNTIFEQLYQFRRNCDFTDPTKNSDILTQAHEDTVACKESERNVVAMLFETEVKECLDHLESVLANPDQYNLLKELLIVSEALSGLGEMLLIPAFSQLCQSITQHLDNTPEHVEEIARIALSHLRRAQTAVLLGQIDSLPFEIELASTDFDTSSLQNEPFNPWSKNQHNIESITEEDQLDFNQEPPAPPLPAPLPLLDTFSSLNLELPSVNKNEVNEHTVCIPIEQFHQIKEFIEITKTSLSQLDNLLKTIEQQRSSRVKRQGARSREQGEKSLLAPLPTALISPAPCLFDHDVPIEFDDDTIELQDTGVNFPSNSKKHTILVIDDSEAIREFLKSLLLKAGYQVEIAEDGQVAIEKLQKRLLVQRRIDVSAVICDIEMPRITGYDFLIRVKSDDAFKQLPVAMLTSKAEDKDRELAMMLGADAYFIKPCDQQKLLNTLEKFVGTSPAI